MRGASGKGCWLWGILLMVGHQVLGQAITVIDTETGQPVQQAFIYSEDSSSSVSTGPSGRADVSGLIGQGTFYIQHPAYHPVRVNNEQLDQWNFRVGLTPKVITIDEIVISAHRWETPKSSIPNQIISLVPGDIRFNNPQTSADLLGSGGQVFIQKSQFGGGSPMIRGFAANSLLIAVDGIRMNNAIFRDGNLQNVVLVDPNVLKSAEVLLGPGSVAYGSDALGGVMNFEFQDPRFSEEANKFIEVTALSRFSSANLERTGHVHFNLAGNKVSSLSSITFSHFDDLVTGNKRSAKFPSFGQRLWFVDQIDGIDSLVANSNPNRQLFSGYQQVNLLQKFRLRLKEQGNLAYGFYYTTSSDVPRFDRLVVEQDQGLPQWAEWSYGPQKWMLHTLEFSDYERKAYEKMAARLSYQRMGESRKDRKYKDPILRNRTEQVDVGTLNLDFQLELNPGQRLTYGVEMVYNKVISTANGYDIQDGSTYPVNTRYPDGGSQTGYAAVYAAYQATWRKFNFSTGIRYDYSVLRSIFSDTSFYSFPYEQINLSNGALSGSLGGVFRTGTWRFTGLISNGFRSPNVDDIGKVFDSEPGNVVVPNPDLGPEYTYNIEGGIFKSLGKKVELSATIFYTLLRDAMVRHNFPFNGRDSILYEGVLSRTQSLVNVGRAYIWGYHFDLEIAFNSWLTLKSTLANTDGRDQIENLPLRHTTPPFGQTALWFDRGTSKGRLLFRYSGKRTFSELPLSEQNKPYLYTPDGSLPWATCNLHIFHQANSWLQVNTGIENLLNVHYRPYSSGISAPGRNLVISLLADL